MLSLSHSHSLSLTSRPLFHSITHFSPHRRRHCCTSINPSSIKMSSSSETTIEHIVLFNVKPDTPQTKLTTMLTNLNSLKSLDMVLHITAGPLFRNRSSSFTFTHLLHSRYRSKDDLAQYSAHPAHMAVVKSDVLPICEDIMAVDWVSHNLVGPVGLSPGSPMRVKFVKLKEGLGDTEKGEVLKVIEETKEKINGIEQLSIGENFSTGRAKGFQIGSIAVFSGVKELECLDENVEIEKGKDKVRDFIDNLVVVDYVVPNSQSAANL